MIEQLSIEQSSFIKLPPLSLYIHIPWCVRKCPYCDFNSHTIDIIPEQDYVDALIADLDQELRYVQGRTLQSIFFGGGTPSLFSAKSIDKILSAVEQRIPFSSSIEITLEANPGTFEQKKFSDYRAAGINRLSIGIQSFNQTHLQSLGRIHDNHEAIHAASAARSSGFNNFNIDLMHGLPNQTQAEGLNDLQQAIDLNPAHISWYQLTIEPNTSFYNAPPLLPSDDLLADIQCAGEEILQQSNFEQYEISAYSQKNQQSQHNTNYWLFGDYIGIGAGAHGKITDTNKGTIQRRWKTRAPNDYLNQDKAFLSGEKTLRKKELPLEFLMNALRLNQGFSTQLFNDRTGISFMSIEPIITKLINQGLINKNGENINTTITGKRFLNNILEQF